MILSCQVLKFMQLLKFKKIYEQQNLVCWWGDKVTQPWHSPKQLQNVTNFWRNHDLGSRNPGSQQGSPAQSQLALLLSELVTPAERNPVLSSSKDPKYVNVPFIHCSNLISTNINSIPKIWKILKIQARVKHIYSNDLQKTINSLLLVLYLAYNSSELWEIQNQYFVIMSWEPSAHKYQSTLILTTSTLILLAKLRFNW